MKNFDYSVGQGFRSSNGHRHDSDGRLTDYNVNLGCQLCEHWDVSLFALRTDNYAKDPGPRGHPELKEGKYETNEWLSTFAVSHQYDRVEGTCKVYWNNGEGDWRNQAGNADNTLNDWDLYGVRGNEKLHLWKGGEILLGSDLDYIAGSAEFTYDDATPPGEFERTRFWLFSPYTAVSHQIGSRESLYVIPSGGIRYYEHGTFDSEPAPFGGLVLGWKKTEVFASYARGVSYPGLNVAVFSENVVPPLGTSWEDLEAEIMDHYETGISHEFGEYVKADLSLFYEDGKDRYVLVPPPPPVFENVEEFTTRGAEAGVTVYPAEKLSVFGGGMYLDNDPNDLPYAPKWSFSGGLVYEFLSDFRFASDAQYVTEMHAGPQLRKSGAKNSEDVGSHFLLNAKLSYKFAFAETGVEAEVFIAGENLTDSDYEYREGYPMPGPGAMAGLRIAF